jgi:outer membrane lipoprotein-sorting protein
MGFIINGEQGKKWRGKDGRSMKFDLSREPIIAAISNQVFSWARGDYGRLKAGYNISIISEEPVEVRLRPLSPVEQKYIESIDLAFSEEESHVTKIEIHDKKGGSTLISFSNMKINPGLSEEIF